MHCIIVTNLKPCWPIFIFNQVGIKVSVRNTYQSLRTDPTVRVNYAVVECDFRDAVHYTYWFSIELTSEELCVQTTRLKSELCYENHANTNWAFDNMYCSTGTVHHHLGKQMLRTDVTVWKNIHAVHSFHITTITLSRLITWAPHHSIIFPTRIYIVFAID